MTADDDTPAVLYIRANRSDMIHRYEVLPPGRTDGEEWVPKERLLEAYVTARQMVSFWGNDDGPDLLGQPDTDYGRGWLDAISYAQLQIRKLEAAALADMSQTQRDTFHRVMGQRAVLKPAP